MDVDGVLSDGKIIYDANEMLKPKALMFQDGFGIQRIHQAGFKLLL